MPTADEIAQQQKLLATYRRNLAHEVERAAKYGGEHAAPVDIANSIYEARSNLRRIKVWLRQHNVPVEDHADDEPANGTGGETADHAELDTLTLPTDAVPPPAPLPLPYRMPHRQNPQFVGRDDDLKRLASLLNAQQTTAIVAATGIDGVGKTQLASEFVHRYGQFFRGGVFWIDCSSEAAMRADIAACGESGALDLPGFEALPNLDTRVVRVHAEWQRPVPRLLVFDNLEDPKLLNLAPTSGGCRVLLTARRTTWSRQSGVTTHALDVLDRANSLRLLLDLGSDQQPPIGNTDADAICEALGDLPLPLTLAGAYLKIAASVTLKSYLHAITQVSVAHPSLNDELDEQLPTKHIPSIVETFRLSYDQLDEAKPTDALARTLLHRAAHCAPAPIPRRLLVRAAALDPDDEASSIRADRALHRLASLGLIAILEPSDDATPPLRLHRLLAAYVRNRATNETKDIVAVEQALIAEMYTVNTSGYTERGRSYLEHALHCAPAATERGDEMAATLLNNLGALLRAQGEYVAARPYYEQALDIRKQVLGDTHPDTARSLNNLGYLLDSQGEYAAAYPYYKQALAINQQVLGDTHPDTALSLNNLGALLVSQREYTVARSYFEQALAIRKQVLGNTHPDIAQSLHNLGTLLVSQGEYPAARPYFEQALAIFKQMLGDTHPDTATSLNNLGVLLASQEEFSAARPYFEQALAIRNQMLGDTHPHTALSLNNLAMLAYDEGDIAEAERLMRQALAIREQMLGPNHPDTQSSQRSFAVIEERLRGEGSGGNSSFGVV